jgi:hypothetical protein
MHPFRGYRGVWGVWKVWEAWEVWEVWGFTVISHQSERELLLTVYCLLITDLPPLLLSLATASYLPYFLIQFYVHR